MSVFEKIGTMGHEQIVFCSDPSSGLKAIIAIHDTTLGPALGGCRLWNYSSEEEALVDVLRLSRGMTYKAAITGLNLGGGKAVIIGDPSMKSEALFRAFGRFVDGLAGRYITAEDVNINVDDMAFVANETRYATGITGQGGSGDPSPITALGTYYGIKAAVKHKLGKDELKGMRIAVQGVGHVGAHLCELLHNDGVELMIADINKKSLEDVSKKCNAQIIASDSIHSAEVDVYAPCALGAIINDQTIPELKATIVAGAANNQLQDENKHGKMLKEKGILYAPDYVINAGGLINVSHELKGYDEGAARRETSKIYETLLKIFNESDQKGICTHEASNTLAEKRIEAMQKTRNLRQHFDNQYWIYQ